MEKATQTARTLLMVAMMIAAAIVPMAPEAVELRDEAKAMGASISTDVTSLTLDEGSSNWYEVSLDEAPDGTLVITPSSDNSVVTLDPSYIKFTKLNWDTPQYVYVVIADTDDDAVNTSATISHAIDGTDTVFASATLADIAITGVDHDVDHDGDGLHDGIDSDDDNDSVADDSDAFPFDDSEDTDTDGDGIGNNADLDDDGDGTNDTDDAFPLDATEDTDTDGDGTGDNGDAFPDDASEDTDTDGDGTGDNADIDADDDMVNDTDEEDGCSLLVDCDADGTNDSTDDFDNDPTEITDTDGDGVGDNSDWNATDVNESVDTDGDLIGNNADTDDDGDGVDDGDDAFPLDSTETVDTDGDGIGDNADIDDDGDGTNDTDDAFPLDASEDTDTDGDGVGDNSDWNATDSTETLDTDGDGVGDNADLDDDNDAVNDTDEASGCQFLVDCDGDGYNDSVDAFDNDPEAWDDFDGDGLADTFPNLLVQASGNYGCTIVDSPSYWSTNSCSFTLPAEGLDLVISVSTDYYGSSESGMIVTDPAGTATTYSSFSSNAVNVVTITAAAGGDWTVTLTDSWGDGGSAASVVYGDYTAGESWLGDMIVPSDSGYGTQLDNDDDGDGFSDADEGTCGTDSMNATDVPLDSDSDGLCDNGVDSDDDDDGVLDDDEEAGCILSTDCDGDGVGDATDTHDNDENETSDMDGDGIGDNSDNDVDGDGYLNTDDLFPNDSTEWADNDGDGTGDNADTDDDTCAAEDGADTDGDGVADATCDTFTGFGSWITDENGNQLYDFYPGDGVADVDDWDPMSPAESADNDGDGWGDNADYDDDNDGIADEDDDDMDGDGFTNDEETTTCASGTSDPQDGSDTPADMDGDGICDDLDDDIDGDGTDNGDDVWPEDACADTDTDGDGLPDTIVTGCTTTLTEDDDDDTDASTSVGVTTQLCNSGGYYAGSTAYSCTFSLAEGESVTMWIASYYYYPYVSGGVTGPDGTDILTITSGSPWSNTYYGPYTEAGDYTIYHGHDYGYPTFYTFADITATPPVYTDSDEIECGTDPLDATDEPADMDGDGLCDEIQDDDNDGDGYTNADEIGNCWMGNVATDGTYYNTSANDSTSVPADNDGDSICDYLDIDDDNDGSWDTNETTCGTDMLDSTEFPIDTDSDGTCNGADTDDDDDGVLDVDEAVSFFTNDCSLVYDCDGDGVSDFNETDGSALDLDDDGVADGIHCAASTDCDGDGVGDLTDVLPANPDETVDFDGDGIGDNADTDDDADGYSDDDESTNCNVGTYASTSDPMNGSDTPADMDGDLTCDALDNDVDGDNIPNPWDQCPADPSGYIDTDGDGLCDGDSDPDDDGDGTADEDDAFPLDASETTDTDGDGVGDNSDADDDGDGTDDQADECPLDSSGITDFDGDGACDESDADDDDDTVDDADEDAGCQFNTDCDGDGVADGTDAFDTDANATTDTDGDGLPDSITGATLTSENYTLTASDNNGDMMVYAEEVNGGTLCIIDTSMFEDSCTFTSEVGVYVYADDVSYSSYLSGGSALLTTSDGTELFNATLAYSWYYDSYYGVFEMHSDTAISTTDGLELDSDDDGDGYGDAAEGGLCSTGDSTDDSVMPDDTDGDMICDGLDTDDDNDGYTDVHETACGTDGLVAGDVSDFDGDGTCDEVDTDDDDDGIADSDDWAQFDSSEWLDTDNDGTGDNEDDDADGDGTADADDSDPTDRCSNTDTDGDGMTDSYDDCSDMGFYTTLDSDEGDNAGEGFDDGDHVGITDEDTMFGGAGAGNQWFQAADIDGTFRMYFDHATGVSAVSMWMALGSTEYEEEDYYASYWVGDDGVTTELGNSQSTWGDIDNCMCEGFWAQTRVAVPSEDGYLMLEWSTDDDAEHWGLDNVGYHDNNWDVISMVTFEDSVEEMGVYMTPSSPDLLVGTYTIDIADSWGDGGQSVTASHDGSVVCDITTDTNGASDSCTFTITGYSDTDVEVDFTSDYYASEGSMAITFPDGTVSSYTPSASYATDSYSFAHTGDLLLPMEGTYTIEIADSYGDGGQTAEVYFDGELVCELDTSTTGDYDSCTYTGLGFADSVLEVDFTSDYYASEGSMDITLPAGTVTSYTPTASYATDSYSFAHSGTEVQPVAGEVMLSNGHGATVSLDTSSYHTGTVDDDDDNDGFADDDDAFPTDDTEWDDMDGDGVGSNTDNDDDGDGTNDGVDDFPRHAHATTDTDGDGMPDEIGMTDEEIHEDWSIGNLTGMDWTIGDAANNTGWVRSGDSLWYVNAVYGAAVRGSIDHNEYSAISITLDTPEGYVSFDYMLSSEMRYDVLSFSIDGMEYMAASGQDYHWEFLCDTAGSYSGTSWDEGSLNDGSIPGEWVNDGYADCGDTDGDGTSDDEGVSGWFSTIESSFETYVDAGEHTFTWTYSKDGSVDGGDDFAGIDNIAFPYTVVGDGECSDGTDDCNIEDLDDDADGVDDEFDDCPTDAGEQTDTDGDGFCDNADADDDNDGTYDYNDAMPLDPNETSDHDGDGIGDNADTDDDNDGCEDEVDDLPYDDSDCVDTDGDGVGDDSDLDDDGDNVMDVDDPFPLDGSAWADNDGDGEADVTGDPPFLGNFEGASIPAGWTTFGDADWFVCGMGTCGTTSGNAINGSYMAESGDIADAETSSIEVSIDTLAGDVSFAYETSTETNWDYLRFYVDGSLTMSWSGVTSGTYTTTVSAGYHTFEWMYYKDFSVSSNADTVWIDDVSLPVSQVTNNSDPDDDNDGVYDEFDLDPLDPCVSLDTDGDGLPNSVLTGLFDMSGTGDEQFIVDCDASMWYEDVDDDGDGWTDIEEDLCGSNNLDGNEMPMDMDQDFVCDDLDEDLDNDGAVNPVNNCELFLESGDTEAFIDCVSDGFHAVDADGDGEASYMELMHAWTFQWAFESEDGDDWVTFFCGDGSEIPFDWVNDMIDDCEDGADEQQYDENGDPINWFDCYDGTQVWIYQVNDGYPDCPDGDDEMSNDWDDVGHEDSDGTDDDEGDEDDGEGSEDMGGIGSRDNHENGTDENGTGDDHDHGDDHENGTGDDHGDDHENGTGDGDDHGDDHDDMEEPEEPEAWPSQDDMDEFDMQFWDWVSQWDADASDSLSFDEFWQINNDTEEDWDFENPGWSEDTTDWDQFPYDPSEQSDTDMDGMGDNSDTDDDNDGVPDGLDAFPLDPTESADLDGDGIGDNSDNDTDGDGIDNDQDDFDSDPNAAADNDQDGVDDASDSDDDNDGVPDVADWAPLDASEQYDTDGDGVGDNADTDDDNDGTADADDAFPLDASESADADGDGVGDNSDPDDDDDGTPDGLDDFPYDATEQRDSDGDGIGDVADPDMDEDGYLNSDDAFPMNANEWLDTDGDNIGDNSDSDIDGDSVMNDDDWAPLDSAEWMDTDGDGTGDNADTDDDGDTYSDDDEYSCGTDSKNANSVPSDFDGDGLCDALDPEDNRGQAGAGAAPDVVQESPGFTPGFASVLAVVSLLGAAALGRREED